MLTPRLRRRTFLGSARSKMDPQSELALDKKRLAHLRGLLSQPLEPRQRRVVLSLIESQKATLKLSVRLLHAGQTKTMNSAASAKSPPFR